ncbi:MAG: polysaccharide deacetylase family protein [Verrucomicrobiota bacterium]|nr:polysaccharide deacetylase family protein [Verrucomicrobiota bacterium]
MTTAAATSFAPVFAAAAEERRPAVISVHDVAPATWENCRRIVTELKRAGVRVSSLLVVPDYHHGGVSTANREFVRWLRDAEADGHEIVIHGYYHERPRNDAEGLRDKFVTRFYTNDEGEFYDLPYAEALARIVRGREEFEAAGLTPRGFIAPAWLLSTEGERAVTDANLEYTTRLTTVRDVRFAETFPSRSLVYSVRTHWRRSVSLLWNDALFRGLKRAPLVRLGLHPPDIDHPEIWSHIRAISRQLADTRTPTTYRDWIADRRAHRAA